MKKFLLLLLLSGAAQGQTARAVAFPPELAPAGLPQTDGEFAAQVLAVARYGQKLDDVQHELEAKGFTCQQIGDGGVTCGPPVPAMHGCQRNVVLRTSAQGLSGIQFNFTGPWGLDSAGDICGR